MAQSKEADYFIRHPEAYNRLETKDISDEGAVRLAEAILIDLKQDMKDISARLKQAPRDKEAYASARTMLRFLRSDYVDGLTMGHGSAVADMFIDMCGGLLR